ncbi:MAG: bifunctional DNA primase/polymerase [Phycisphaerae bacterium]|jgi:hypothetical protein
MGIGASVERLKSITERFLEKDLILVPVEGKKIQENGWPLVEDPLNDFAESVWNKATGVGLILGERTGVICLDIDIEDSESEIRKKILSMLPPIMSGKSGNPKRPPSRFFRYNGETNRKFRNIDVELLCTGNQTVLPPSIHPDTKKPYVWVGSPLSEIEIDDLPYLPEGFLDFLENLNDLNREETKNGAHTPGDTDTSKAPGRCRHGSHNKLSALGVALVHQKYDFERLVKRLLAEDKKYNHGSDYIYFLCPTRPWKHKTALENAKDFVDQLFINHGPGGKKAEKLPEVIINESTTPQAKTTLDLFAIPEMPKQVVYDKDGNEKEVAPSQAEMAEHILNHFGGMVRKFDKDIFSYNGTHWIEWGDEERRSLSEAITYLLDSKTGVGRIKQIEEFILKLMRPFSSNPYIQNPFIANFLDGVLEANHSGDTFALNFRPHSPNDNCLYVLPIKYQCDRSIKNKTFEELLNNTTGKDAEKIRQIKQMYGVILLPIFPHLFLNVGAGGTGKSSVIKCAMKLRNPDSMSFTDPTSWGTSFGLEPMLGKLVNIDLDIETHKPLADSIVKKIEDRHLFPINRKNKKVVNAPIPSVHVFGANKVPPTLEWGTKAHDRRWTFIKYNSFEGSDNSDRDFALRAFDSCPEGVLNFALEGLDDLIKSKGKYFQSAESKALVEEWQLSNDPIGLFMQEISKAGKEKFDGILIETKVNLFGPQRPMAHELKLSYDEKDLDCVIERKKLWLLFCDWHLESYKRQPSMGKVKFFEAVRRINIQEKTIQGTRYFCGFALKSID